MAFEVSVKPLFQAIELSCTSCISNYFGMSSLTKACGDFLSVTPGSINSTF